MTLHWHPLTVPHIRLRNLKENTHCCKFKMMYIPGVKNKASDSISQRPSGTRDPERSYLEDDVTLTSANCATYLDQSPRIFMDMIRTSDETPTEIDRTLSEIPSATLDTICTITWERVRLATNSNDTLLRLVEIIEDGIPESREDFPRQFRDYLTPLTAWSFTAAVWAIGHPTVTKKGMLHRVTCCTWWMYIHDVTSRMLNLLHTCHTKNEGTMCPVQPNSPITTKRTTQTHDPASIYVPMHMCQLLQLQRHKLPPCCRQIQQLACGGTSQWWSRGPHILPAPGICHIWHSGRAILRWRTRVHSRCHTHLPN